ncbi:MAG: hypothetical protein H7X92_02030 [Chitinophagales bacterium]|nr:hypothetical protein [Hyphomicrobiales bacterium]
MPATLESKRQLLARLPTAEARCAATREAAQWRADGTRIGSTHSPSSWATPADAAAAGAVVTYARTDGSIDDQLRSALELLRDYRIRPEMWFHILAA